MTATQQEAWTGYYRELYAEGKAWLDYSNPRVQEQTFGVALESAGPVGGKRCLDVGCGRGQLALALAALQAKEVVGVDIMVDSIASFREKYPQVKWQVGTPEDADFCESIGRFDVIFIIELLQLVDWRKVLKNLWGQINPGGRVVAICPNEDDAIVQKTIARFNGTYVAPNPRELVKLVKELPELDFWGYRGMSFQLDQRILPYATSPWMDSVVEGFSSNRLVIVLQKQVAAPI